MTTPIREPNSEPVGESATDALNDASRSFPHTPDATLEGYEWPTVALERLLDAMDAANDREYDAWLAERGDQ